NITPEVFDVAKKYATNLQAQVPFLECYLLQPLIDLSTKVEIFVSNPPYIAKHERDKLSDTVKNFDPAIALFAENNGLRAYQTIISQLPHVIIEGGSVYFEIGHTQGKAVASLLKETF